ncbi:putative DNA repair protein Rad1 [Dioszegia hungarica]|uniref:DNA repair protein Rad1 n=1 Tax=Dioszegia hungarica TaxID=4972 RepID=A0AA38HCV4_9TREE|nr:putative DNA repair protein Rad1 [Dioszegia hungarica]KAI9637818.1 putative DNA repair protein Rad1 [Dioszegia hungarica]
MSQDEYMSQMKASQAGATQILVAQTDDVRPFARLLRGIGLKHNAVMVISNEGFEITVEEVKTLSAIAYIPTNLFQTFTYAPPDDDAPAFEISLDSLLQCLNIFGNAGSAGSGSALNNMGGKKQRRWAGEGEGGGDDDTSFSSGRGGGRERRTGMRMTWAGHGEPLSMFLQDDGKGPVTTCELSTYQPEEMMAQAFDIDNRAVYVIMKSELFRDALLDLPPSSTKITLTATPPRVALPDHLANATSSSNLRRAHKADVGNLGIKAQGDFGETQLDYPNEKSVMETFDVETEVQFSYHYAHFAMLSRALQQSVKIALQIEHTGYLCLQIMMPITKDLGTGVHMGILEFKMNALEEDEE